jgi:hypothetical protein
MAELGVGGTTSLNDTDVRALAGKPSGGIAFSDLRGKSSALGFELTGSACGANYTAASGKFGAFWTYGFASYVGSPPTPTTVKGYRVSAMTYGGVINILNLQFTGDVRNNLIYLTSITLEYSGTSITANLTTSSYTVSYSGGITSYTFATFPSVFGDSTAHNGVTITAMRFTYT